MIAYLHDTSSVADKHDGRRVRVILNPQLALWYVYSLENEILFSSARLALIHVSVYGELKPKFAPNGAPSFVGTVTRFEPSETRKLMPHQYVPSKLYYADSDSDDDGLVEVFKTCKHALLDRTTILVSDQLQLKEENGERSCGDDPR